MKITYYVDGQTHETLLNYPEKKLEMDTKV